MRLFELINVAKTFQNVGDKLQARLDTDESSDVKDAKKLIQYVSDTVDPTRNSKYTMWILRMYIKGGINMYEDFGRVQAYLIIFDKYKQKMPIKDINQFKSLSDFGEMVLAFEIPDEEEPEQQSKKVKKKSEEQKFYDNGDADLKFDSNKVKVVVPHTQEASCYFGKNTQWCTAAASSRNYFDSYNKAGKLYIVLDKKQNKRWQFQSGDNGLTLMDENDRSYSISNFIQAYPEVLTIKSVFDKKFDGGNFNFYKMPSNNYLLHSPHDVEIMNAGDRGLQISSRYGRDKNMKTQDMLELYPKLLEFKKLFKFEKMVGDYAEYTLPKGTKLFFKSGKKSGLIQTFNVAEDDRGPLIEINGKKSTQHDFIEQLPVVFYGLYDPIANFGRFEVYHSKDKAGEYIVRSQSNTYTIEFGGKMGSTQTARYDKKPQKAQGMVVSEDNKKVPTIHEFFNEFPEVLTVEEIFVTEGNREGFEVYKLPQAQKNMQHMLRNEKQTMIVKEDIARTIRSITFAMPPRTIRKGFGFAAPFEEGLAKLPGASKNNIIKHTSSTKPREGWHNGWDTKGKGRQSFEGGGGMDSVKKNPNPLPKVWMKNGAPMEIEWYEIYGLLGELADWGELIVRWSYYAHGKDKAGNEYWYAYDQGGHIQSGTGTYRFKPA